MNMQQQAEYPFQGSHTSYPYSSHAYLDDSSLCFGSANNNQKGRNPVKSKPRKVNKSLPNSKSSKKAKHKAKGIVNRPETFRTSSPDQRCTRGYRKHPTDKSLCVNNDSRQQYLARSKEDGPETLRTSSPDERCTTGYRKHPTDKSLCVNNIVRQQYLARSRTPARKSPTRPKSPKVADTPRAQPQKSPKRPKSPKVADAPRAKKHKSPTLPTSPKVADIPRAQPHKLPTRPTSSNVAAEAPRSQTQARPTPSRVAGAAGSSNIDDDMTEEYNSAAGDDSGTDDSFFTDEMDENTKEAFGQLDKLHAKVDRHRKERMGPCLLYTSPSPRD